MFRIWSNVHQQWWMPSGRGYTPRLELAGSFTDEQAVAIYREAARGWLPDRPFDITVTLVPID